MENVEIAVGLLRSWNADRGFGFVEQPTGNFPIKRFFLHVREILEGPCPPPVGSLVRFEVGPPLKDGKFPMAKKALIFLAKDFTFSKGAL
jgi:cold shock CspA family protein